LSSPSELSERSINIRVYLVTFCTGDGLNLIRQAVLLCATISRYQPREFAWVPGFTPVQPIEGIVLKFATLKDGRFVLVSRDMSRAASIRDITVSMLEALGEWSLLEPALQSRYEILNKGLCDEAFPLDLRTVGAPLPRPSQWLDSSAFEYHGRLMERAFGLAPIDYMTSPLLYQGNADDFIGPYDDVIFPSESDEADFEGELGVILDDTPMGVSREDAVAHVRLLVLINDVSLRRHAAREMRTGFGWVQAKPCTALGPVAVTPDELGASWKNARCGLSLSCFRSGDWFGAPAGDVMAFGFDQIIEYAAYSRPLRAGVLIGSGTFSSSSPGSGSACIAERRAIEMIDFGEARTPFLKSGETVRMEMLGLDRQSVFGAIEQRYLAAAG
jgi:fumarylacetoacetate (FAA) hydrolase